MSEKIEFRSIITRSILLFGIALFSFPAFAQLNFSKPIYIWHGFSHQWGYNHRVNRLGSFIETPAPGDSSKLSIVHTAASGSGSDVASFRTFFQKIESPQLISKNGMVQFHFQGKEWQKFQLSQHVEVDIDQETFPNDLNGKRLTMPGNGEALLNGFDLRPANGVKADKFVVFGVSIRNVRIEGPDSLSSHPSIHRLTFDVEAEFQFACTTPECEVLNQEVDYLLDVHWLGIMGDFLAYSNQQKDHLTWDKNDLPTPNMLEVELKSGADFKQLAGGIKGFRLDLEGHDLHFSELDLLLGWKKIDESTSAMRPRIYFGQWNHQMYTNFKKYYTGRLPIPAKWATLRKAGSCGSTFDSVSLHFREGQVQRKSLSGEVDWQTSPGEQRDANGPSAVTKVPIR